MAFDWGNAFRGGASGAAAGSSFGPWGAAGGGLLGALSGFFGNNDEEKKTNKYLDQIPDELKKYLQPYIDAGRGAYGHLNDISSEYERSYKDPNSIISSIGAGYKESPGFRWKLNQGENAINNASAAGGMAGTSQHQQQAGELANNLASQDFNEFMERALGVRREGLTGRTGIEQNIFDTGANASGSLASGLASLLQGKAGLNYARGANSNQMNSDLLSSLLSFFKNRGG
jgi:hypothetical protein